MTSFTILRVDIFRTVETISYMEFVREGSVMIIEFDDVTCLKFIIVEITLIVVTWFYREIEAK